MNNRIDLINKVIDLTGAKSYLEIGVYEGESFNSIDIKKVGVDPISDIEFVINKNSDEFFKDNKEKFDVIFIDGDHSYNQVKRDVANALDALTTRGVVIMHDTCPTKRLHVEPKVNEGQEWCGEAYKVAIEYNNSADYQVITLNKDFGVTIIKKGESICNDYECSFEDLKSNNYKSVNAQSESEIIDFLTLVEDDIPELEMISVKEYYKLHFPKNRIGRKKEETLIKELKEAGISL